MSALLVLRSPRTVRVVAITLLWLTRTLTSLLVAYPVVLAVAASGLASGPERDAVLFRPGALALLELARSGAPLFSAALKESLLLGVLALVLGLVPLGVALDLLQTQDADAFRARALRGFQLFPQFLGLSSITVLAQAALLLAASLLEGASSAALQGHDERLLTLLPIFWFGIALVCCACLGAVLDVARAGVVQRGLGARAALFGSLTILRANPLGVLVGVYPSVTGSVLAWLCAAWLLGKIDLANPAPRGVALAFVVHQAAVLFGLALRVRWLDGALTLSADARGASARD